MSERTFDHSKLSRRHWEPGVGPCCCAHCRVLPDYEPASPVPPATAATGGDETLDRAILSEAAMWLDYLDGVSRPDTGASPREMASAIRRAGAAVAALRAERDALRADLDAIRLNCKVVFWPPLNEYPIEHTLLAGHNAFDLILSRMRAARAGASPAGNGETPT